MGIIVAIVGWAGMVVFIVAYALLTARKLDGNGRPYQALNVVGALALLWNTAYNSAWPSAVLNLVWCGIGVVGLVRIGRHVGPRPVVDTVDR